MNISIDDYVLVIGSKPLSKLPNIYAKKVYCANGAAERCLQYKNFFTNTIATAVVSASEYNKRIEVRSRIIELNPDNLYCRFGSIDKRLLIANLIQNSNVTNLTRFKQFLWQAKFYKYGVLTLLLSEAAYEKNIFKKIKHLYKCIKWRGFLCSSTGLFSILLAHSENPKSTILVSGIGIKSGGETYYGSNKDKTQRSNVDKELFKKLNKEVKKKLITTDKEMAEFCKIPLWDKELLN
jgi:hypothetical protein|tara:strand:+ start:375 stop:1085 length:711 start_codon:yes stop_codon:yes gene_type:complete